MLRFFLWHGGSDNWFEFILRSTASDRVAERNFGRTEKAHLQVAWWINYMCEYMNECSVAIIIILEDIQWFNNYYLGIWNYPYNISPVFAIDLKKIIVIRKLQEISFPELMCKSALSGTVWRWEQFPRKRSFPKFRKNITFESLEYVSSTSTQYNSGIFQSILNGDMQNLFRLYRLDVGAIFMQGSHLNRTWR